MAPYTQCLPPILSLSGQMAIIADLKRVMTSTSVEILAGISIESTFNELDTERLELLY